jgi:putative FmdB family regulatory protein
MPVYEYLCRRCSTSFELLRPMSYSQDRGECPDCEGPGDRILSVFAAFSTGDGGEPMAMPGMSMGGCACAAGGACACG